MRKLIYTVLLFCGGCVSTPPEPGAREYREIPEGYLQECEVPTLPTDNGEMSEAFVLAAKCAELGNADKRRIRELQNH